MKNFILIFIKFMIVDDMFFSATILFYFFFFLLLWVDIAVGGMLDELWTSCNICILNGSITRFFHFFSAYINVYKNVIFYLSTQARCIYQKENYACFENKWVFLLINIIFIYWDRCPIVMHFLILFFFYFRFLFFFFFF